jgi:hypothetical protein
VQIETSHRLLFLEPDIVVAAYEVKRGFKRMNQAGKVFRRKITTGYDDIDVTERFTAGILVQYRIHYI